jgi:DNA-binding NtrC family response regulator
MKFGSYDYLQKPFKLDHLKLIIDRIVEERKVQDKAALLRRRSRERYRFHQLVGISPRMQQVYDLIESVARQNPMVLIQGESGTGKELVARTIHKISERGEKPFVSVNCSSVSESVAEEDIQTHVAGLLQKVEGGTLYLDEIAELSSQVRLAMLQALKEISGDKDHSVRIIAASTRELGEVIASGALKKDTFDLLNAVLITMPPLRERREDICLLMLHFLYELCTKQKKRVISLVPQAFDILMRYHWPGNLIQLQNVIERALALGVEDVIKPEDLPEEILTFSQISKMT